MGTRSEPGTSGASIPDGEDATWWRFSTQAKSTTIDLETDEGKDQFHNLVEETDLAHRRSHPPGRTTTRHRLRGHPHHFTVTVLSSSRILALRVRGQTSQRTTSYQALTGATKNNLPEKNQLHVRRTRRFRRSRIERTSDTRNHRITKQNRNTY